MFLIFLMATMFHSRQHQRNLCPRFVTQQNAVASCYLEHIEAQSDSVQFGPTSIDRVSGVEFTALGNRSRVVHMEQSRPGIVDYPKVQLRTQTLSCAAKKDSHLMM